VPNVENASFLDRCVAFMKQNVFAQEKLRVLGIKETKMRRYGGMPFLCVQLTKCVLYKGFKYQTLKIESKEQQFSLH
jgi:hypothetical protein